MARKIQQRQKFYRRKRWLLSTSMFIILPAVLVIGYVKVSAFCGIYNSNSLLCQYQGGYTQVGGDWAKLTWSGGAIGSPGSPSDVSAGSTVSLTGSYNSVEPSNGQTVVGWVNISTGQPGAQSITAGGAPSYVFNNGCFAEVAQIPGKSGPAANPYGNNNWYSASGGSGVFACGSVENNPPRDTLSNQYPGYFATTYSNVDSTLNNGSPVGSSVVWNNGTSTAKTNTFNIKFSSSITQPIQVCMRYHVSITANPGAATDIAGGNANGIAKNDLSDIVAVAGQTDSASAACFLVHPNPPPTNISSCNNINVTDSGTNPATMISYSPVIAPDGSTVAPDGSSWSSDQNSKDTGTNGLVWTHTSVSVTGGGVNISTNLGHGYSSVGINQNFIPLSQTITVSINRR